MRKFHGNPWAVLIVVSLGFFMTLLDLTIVNIAIPNLITNLHASLDDVLWVINAYALVLAVLVITAGRLGDLVGPRIMFTSGVAVFTAASAACGLAPSPGLADRVPRGPGAGRGHAHAADPDDHHEHVPGGTARRRVRHLGRRGRGGHDRRADPGRAPGHRVRLAVDLLREPARRRDRAGDHPDHHPRPAPGPPAPDRHPRRAAGQRRAAGDLLWPGRGAEVQLGHDHRFHQHPADPRPGRGAAARLPAGPEAHPGQGATDPVRPVPRPELLGGQLGVLCAGHRHDGHLPAAHHLLPVRPRLHRAEGRARHGAGLPSCQCSSPPSRAGWSTRSAASTSSCPA